MSNNTFQFMVHHVVTQHSKCHNFYLLYYNPVSAKSFSPNLVNKITSICVFVFRSEIEIHFWPFRLCAMLFTFVPHGHRLLTETSINSVWSHILQGDMAGRTLIKGARHRNKTWSNLSSFWVTHDDGVGGGLFGCQLFHGSAWGEIQAGADSVWVRGT